MCQKVRYSAVVYPLMQTLRSFNWTTVQYTQLCDLAIQAFGSFRISRNVSETTHCHVLDDFPDFRRAFWLCVLLSLCCPPGIDFSLGFAVHFNASRRGQGDMRSTKQLALQTGRLAGTGMVQQLDRFCLTQSICALLVLHCCAISGHVSVRRYSRML